MLTSVATVEAFHLVFLKAFAGSVPADTFSVKGGCNLRFFFGSARYSEDLDLDIQSVPVHQVRDRVMSILESGGLNAAGGTYGIAEIRPPNLSKAKQTETTQRFKVHLLTTSGEDLHTKIEFSRRGMSQTVTVEPILTDVLAAYRMPALILPHYAADAAATQKISALVGRSVTQARDVFDLHVLSAQPEFPRLNLGNTFSQAQLKTALANTYSIEYEQFRDTVVSFLGAQDQQRYASKTVWDQIRLVVISLIEQALADGA